MVYLGISVSSVSEAFASTTNGQARIRPFLVEGGAQSPQHLVEDLRRGRKVQPDVATARRAEVSAFGQRHLRSLEEMLLGRDAFRQVHAAAVQPGEVSCLRQR